MPSPSFLPISLVNSTNSLFCLLFGSILNIFLWHLARKYSHAELKEYRPVVNYFCALNLLLLLLHALNQPIFFISEDLTAYIFVQGVAARLDSIPTRFALLQCFLYLQFLDMTGLGWQFLGRYLLICRGNAGSRVTHRRYALCLCNSLYFLLPSIATFFTALPAEEEFVGSLLLLGENAAAVGAHDWAGTKIGMRIGARCPLVVSIHGWLVFGLVACYLSIFLCYLKIRAFMKRHLIEDSANKFIRKRDMIRQISRNMLLQACLPLFGLSLCSFCILLFIFGQYSRQLVQFELLAFLPLNWLPLLNPLVTILTIHHYRNGALLELTRRERRRRGELNEDQKVPELGRPLKNDADSE